MDIWDVIVFHPHPGDDPTWIVMPWETHEELHFLQQLFCFFPSATIVANEGANLPFDSELFLFL
jgi:hypothetical protein